MHHFKAMILLLGLVACAGGQRAASVAPIDVGFDWAGVSACSSAPPAFTLTGVPAGTQKLRFAMTDLDVPTFNHGGGTISYTGAEIPAGAFSYTGPCPPSGSHDYRWTVQALDAAGVIIGEGQATRPFPPR